MTEKIAYVFPGQGAQYRGMGKDFFDNFIKNNEIKHYEISTYNYFNFEKFF